MSKAERLELLRKNLSQQTNNFEEADKDMAFSIWYVEHEFNVGPISEDFPLMKFFNLVDAENVKRWNKLQKSSNDSGGVKTLR